MGVTLERVQNKFACIIGELCNEPLVLSQFAVWVDLRIAEYKTNGKISLDCSGDSPNPPWMKGVKNERHRLGSNSVDTGQSGSHRGRGSYTSPGGSPLYSDRVHMPESPRLAHVNSHQAYSSRLSPDVMVIKDEPGLDSQSLCAGGRKRLSDSGDFQSNFHSPSKSARLGNTSLTLSTPQESSSNQSLMSIINAETDSVVLEQVDAADSDIFRSSVSELDVSHGSTSSNPTFSPQRHHTNSSSPASQSTWANQFGQSTQSSSSHTAGHVTDPNDENGPSNSSGYTLDPGYAGPCLNPSTRDDTLDPGYAGPCLNPSTRDEFKRRKSATSMRIFEKWLRYSATETRRAVNIPSAELSSYLVRFFKEVKKQNGQDYTVKSLDSLRDGIKMYLQAANYGHCIVSSPDFFRSQISYRIRRRQLFLKGATGQQSSECGSDL